MARRFSSIRTWIILLVLVPLFSLAALWAFATGITYGDARQLQQSNQFQEKSLLPTQRLIAGLQRERRLSVGRIGGARAADAPTLSAQRGATDRAVADVRRHSRDKGMRAAIEPEVVRQIDAFVARLGALDAIRRGVDGRAGDRARAMEEYTGLIDAAFAIYSAVVPSDAEIASEGRTLIALARAREFLSREDALVTGAVAGGRFSAAEHAQFAQLAGAQRYLYADNAAGLPAALRDRLQRLTAAPEFAQLRRLEEQLLRGADPVEHRKGAGGSGGSPAAPAGGTATGSTDGRAPAAGQVEATAWRTAVDSAAGRLFTFENEALGRLTAKAEDASFGVLQRLAVAGGLGLLAIIVSVVIAVRVSRRLMGECRTLAAGVLDFTRRTLPDLEEQVREGRPLDPGAGLPQGDYRISEIRQISDSFVVAREAVLVGAARELSIRGGLSEVFVNLARRNQALLHRQLSLLDTMERRTDDPAELSDLFRLDHLATRMRRHAEGLVILAGKSAGRGWRRPVPIVDVVRGAVAEVEDYQRVRVQQLPRVALQGTAVADVIHMLAEIVENATTYSPPQAPVRISAHTVPNGLVIEVEDRGLGMTEHDLAAANERLADPPEFDPSDSARLGLFVVARLARRHGITVTLRHSPYGGTTAITLVPASLITDVPENAGRRATGEMAIVRERAGAGVASGASTTGPVRLVTEPAPEPPAPTAPPTPPAPPPAAPIPAEATPAMPLPKRPVAAEPPAPAEPARDEPARREPPPRAPAPPAPAAPAPPLADGELPRRKRQTHLAPQLRERVDADLAAEGRPIPGQPVPGQPVPAPPVPAPPTPLAAPHPPVPPTPAGAEPPAGDPAPDGARAEREDGPSRTPEDIRSMMSAMQRGWERGRTESGQAQAGQPRAEEDDIP
ncbi:nitrate- and nitrite sensing domain-containing protein [Actinomadura viridis]|uniref:histidine kinase n=1 Tax=Actinomadura viridis TaxID=58110 RepID=A0A931DF64_9ACTN|nr:nitrate- and nitrite sensing domain-containing protein [Actinomadura viridis]MBG6087508.1 signal transduction histidine kinase [Actinomadura viridis]